MDRFLRSIIVAVIFLFISCPFSLGMSNLSNQRSVLIGKKAPDADLPRTDGTTGSVIASRYGKKTILVFWATWCPHCYEDLGSINDNLAAIEQKGIEIILVDMGESAQVVKDYFKRRQMKLSCFVDEGSDLMGAYHLVGVPTLIFIDQRGIIRFVTHEFPADYQVYFNS